MKKILLFLLILVVACPVKYIGLYDEKQVISTDNYVLKLSEDFTATINNKYVLKLIPNIVVDKQFLSLLPNFSAPQGEYVFQGSSELSKFFVSEKIKTKENMIVSEMLFENKRAESALVEVSYSISADSFKLFSPTLYDNFSNNYFIATNSLALGIISSHEISPYFENLEQKSSYAQPFAFEISSGTTLQLKMIYYPFNLKLATEKKYPLEFSSFMHEPLIKTSGKIELSLNQTDTNEKIKVALASLILNKTNGSFSGLHNVAFNKELMDSLDFSIYFKQICIQNDVPCRLVIGKKEEKYYAWIKAFTDKWVDVDVFNGVIIRPEGYGVLYLEPQLEFHLLSEESPAAFYEETSWLKTVGKINFFMHFVIIIGIAVFGILFLHTKAGFLNKFLRRKGKIMPIKIELNGFYDVLNEDLEDPFMLELIKKIKEKGGEVNTEEYADLLHYSKELIEFGIKYLIDKGFIKKKF